ncbi:hypothetical protein [Rhizobium sp. Root1220]|uniref:hypothetical protein n=1 Tax=Rhizobium sp. Root1220 TaxID=1736432 RepID=UPI0006FA3953|nr:hypothetical protein [Rhizobium sp. Root1220]KQV79622.1 hypothetical protein ASC90_26265 [Rhizobium sp. Root1220]
MPGEEAMYAQFRQLLDVAAKDPAIKKRIVEEAIATEDSVIQSFRRWEHNGVPAGNGWNSSPSSLLARCLTRLELLILWVRHEHRRLDSTGDFSQIVFQCGWSRNGLPADKATEFARP